MPFHFPGTFGSNEVLSTQVPYFAGAMGLSICKGFPPFTPRGMAPRTSPSGVTGGDLSGREVVFTLLVAT